MLQQKFISIAKQSSPSRLSDIIQEHDSRYAFETTASIKLRDHKTTGLSTNSESISWQWTIQDNFEPHVQIFALAFFYNLRGISHCNRVLCPTMVNFVLPIRPILGPIERNNRS